MQSPAEVSDLDGLFSGNGDGGGKNVTIRADQDQTAGFPFHHAAGHIASFRQEVGPFDMEDGIEVGKKVEPKAGSGPLLEGRRGLLKRSLGIPKARRVDADDARSAGTFLASGRRG